MYILCLCHWCWNVIRFDLWCLNVQLLTRGIFIIGHFSRRCVHFADQFHWFRSLALFWNALLLNWKNHSTFQNSVTGFDVSERSQLSCALRIDPWLESLARLIKHSILRRWWICADLHWEWKHGSGHQLPAAKSHCMFKKVIKQPLPHPIEKKVNLRCYLFFKLVTNAASVKNGQLCYALLKLTIIYPTICTNWILSRLFSLK